jgi:hypothetical protein
MQQGRVQLDADWNEQVSLGQDALRQTTADLVGGSGGPAHDLGFEVVPELAWRFDGSHVIPVADADGLLAQSGAEHTLELWCTWNGEAGVIVQCGTHGHTANAGYRLQVDAKGYLTCIVVCGTYAPIRAVAESPLEPHVRTHVAVVFGDGDVALYASSGPAGDVVQLVRTPVGACTIEPDALFLGGPPPPDPDTGFNGLISGATFSPYIRTVAELQAAAPPGPDSAARPTGVQVSWHPHDVGAAELAGPRAPASAFTGLWIGPGRYYVDGVPCEQPAWRRMAEGPGWTSEPLTRSGRSLVFLETWEESVDATQDPSLREIALGGVDTSVMTQTVSCVRTVPLDGHGRDHEDAVRRTLLRERNRTTGALRAEHSGDLAPGNYLYRVEIHGTGFTGGDDEAGGPDSRPTFKWSRRNGAETFGIAAVTEPDAKTVQLLGRSSSFEPLQPRDIVEVLDSAVPLDGPANPLLEVVEATADGTVRLSGPVPSGVARHPSQHPFLRRWNQPPPAGDRHGVDGAVPITHGWIELEDGIRVEFAPDRSYRRGDYWWIVARQDLRSIEWPHEQGRPSQRPPDGVGRRLAPLALLDVRGGGVEVEDLRHAFDAGRPGIEPGPDGPAEPFPPEPFPPEPFPPIDPWPAPEPWTPPAPEGAFPVVGRQDEPPPGYASTGVELVTRARWQLLARLGIAAEDFESVTSAGASIVVATSDAVWMFDGAEVHRRCELPERRHGFAICVIEDLLLVIGGRPHGRRPDRRVLAHHAGHDDWEERKRMPKRHEGHAAVVSGGHVHVFGGRRGRWTSKAHHLHHIEADRWRRARPMPKRSTGLAAAKVGPHIRVVGGADRRGRPLAHHVALDTFTGRWHRSHPLPAAYRVHGAAGHREHHVVLVHDDRDERGHHVLSYDHAVRAWQSLPRLPLGSTPLALTARGDNVVALAEDASGELLLYELRLSALRGDWTIFVPDPDRRAL